MAARIIDIRRAAAKRLARTDLPTVARKEPRPSPRFEFWTGASGQSYVHTIFGLIECPELPRATYLLVRRDQDGRRHVVGIGRLDNDAESLNLAEIRHNGAKLGANEVHVHLLAGTDHQRRLIEHDLCAALGTEARPLVANT